MGGFSELTTTQQQRVDAFMIMLNINFNSLHRLWGPDPTDDGVTQVDTSEWDVYSSIQDFLQSRRYVQIWRASMLQGKLTWFLNFVLSLMKASNSSIYEI